MCADQCFFFIDIVKRAISSSDKNTALDSNYNDHLGPAKDKRKKLRCSEFEYQDTHGSTMITEASQTDWQGRGTEGKFRDEWSVKKGSQGDRDEANQKKRCVERREKQN